MELLAYLGGGASVVFMSVIPYVVMRLNGKKANSDLAIQDEKRSKALGLIAELQIAKSEYQNKISKNLARIEENKARASALVESHRNPVSNSTALSVASFEESEKTGVSLEINPLILSMANSGVDPETLKEVVKKEEERFQLAAAISQDALFEAEREYKYCRDFIPLVLRVERMRELMAKNIADTLGRFDSISGQIPEVRNALGPAAQKLRKCQRDVEAIPSMQPKSVDEVIMFAKGSESGEALLARASLLLEEFSSKLDAVDFNREGIQSVSDEIRKAIANFTMDLKSKAMDVRRKADELGYVEEIDMETIDGFSLGDSVIYESALDFISSEVASQSPKTFIIAHPVIGPALELLKSNVKKEASRLALHEAMTEAERILRGSFDTLVKTLNVDYTDALLGLGIILGGTINPKPEFLGKPSFSDEQYKSEVSALMDFCGGEVTTEKARRYIAESNRSPYLYPEFIRRFENLMMVRGELEKQNALLKEFTNRENRLKDLEERRNGLFDKARKMEASYSKSYVNIIPLLLAAVEEAHGKVEIDKKDFDSCNSATKPVENWGFNVDRALNLFEESLDALEGRLGELQNFRSKVLAQTKVVREELRTGTTEEQRGGSRDKFNEVLALLYDVESRTWDSGDPVMEFNDAMKTIRETLIQIPD